MAALQAGQTQHAAELLISAHAAGTLPERSAVLPELTRGASPKLVAELLYQMATFPCFYCRLGLQRCEACDGGGRLGDDLPCERCVGLGVARCDFCDGTGWTSLEALPPSLRPLIILQRVQLALRAGRKLLAQAPAPVEYAGEREARRAAARQVLAVERQRAILRMRWRRPNGPGSIRASAKNSKSCYRPVRPACRGSSPACGNA